MAQTVLWLDDHFDEFGELFSPVVLASGAAPADRRDRILDMDKREVEKRLPGVTIVSETRVSGFTQQLLNHIRLVRDLPVCPERAHIFSGIVIDIMISGTTKIPYPVLNEQGDAVFDKDGRVKEWATACSRDNGFDAGLVIAEKFIFAERHLNKLPCIFYTNRDIDRDIRERAERFKLQGGTVDAFEKVFGADPIIARLEKTLGET